MMYSNTKAALAVLAATLLVAAPAHQLMAIEEPDYDVLLTDGAIEVRDYVATVVAEVTIDSEFEDAGNAAFRPLFEYIDDNGISMTAPVSQRAEEDRWAVSFMMPAAYTADQLPEPSDGRVEIREIPARRVAAIQYSGAWSTENYLRHLAKLEEWVQENDYQVDGEAVWARYNSPFSLWFARRNEIHLPLSATQSARIR